MVLHFRVRRCHSGFLLLEALIAFTLLGLFLLAVGLTLLLSHRGVLAAGDRTRGIGLAERALEAARSIRDQSFASVTDGNHGVVVGTGASAGQWKWSGTAVTGSGYTTVVTVSTIAADRKRADARTSWNFGASRSGSVLLTTELTDWRLAWSVGNWGVASLDGSITEGAAVVFRDVLVVASGSTLAAYVTGDDSVAGNGVLVAYDVTTMPPTKQWSETFGGQGLQLAVRGSTLYVLTRAAGSEVRVYNIASLFSPALLSSRDIPGSGRARSIAVRQDALLVGAAQDAVEAELYAYAIPQASIFTLSGSLQMTDGSAPISINMIGLRGKYGYLATSQDTAELRVAGVDDAERLTAQSASGYNLTDRSEDGTAIAITGTAALIGTQGGSLFSEAVLLTATGAVPRSPPGPWAHEAGSGVSPSAQVNDIAMDPSQRYAFCAVEGDRDLQIVDLRKLQQGQPEEVFSATLAGFGRAVHYNIQRDRLYMLTDTILSVYKPG
ncbi:MAG: Uncharacterized protein G01um101425_202 [Candidatus Peregrinibacteria bacterium Gr01-1014_25]|nr:MAG: Uncharacterized protein G01um101425_202 [Candidatus Peregrinibacteria bacterium Gr01-1014_25]